MIFVEYGLFNILQAVIGKSLIQFVWQPESPYKWIFIIGFLIIPWIINEKLLFKNEKYLEYFDEFEKQSNKMRCKWLIISFGIIGSIILFFIMSFVILKHFG